MTEGRTPATPNSVKRTPVAHVVFPRPSRTRPVPEFTWHAATALTQTDDLDVTVLMPVPVGPARRLQGWARRLRGAGAWPPDLDAVLERLNPRPVLVPYLPLPRRSTESAALALAAHLARRPRAGRPQVVQGSFLDEGGYAATTIARVLNVPSIVVGHGTDVRVARAQEAGGVGRRRRARTTLAHAAHVIAVSHQLAQELSVLGVRAEVLPFTSDAQRFVLTEPPEGPPEVLFVGRVGKAKGVDRLLEAFARISRTDARLRLVGPEVGDIDVRAMASRLGVAERVVLEGELAQEELPLRYHRSACLALPSRGEGLPCVVVESLLCGRPVVASAVGGVEEIVNDQVGALVSGDDVDGLAAAIEEVLGRRFDGVELRRRAIPFTWQASGPRLVELTRTLLGR